MMKVNPKKVKLAREHVLHIVSAARQKGGRLDLRGTDLSDANLSVTDLSGGNFGGANLTGADLN